MSPTAKITTLVMAAARGPDDPMARAFKAQHKCLIDIDGIPMLVRVVEALKATPEIGSIGVSIDRFDVLDNISGLKGLDLYKSGNSAPNSAALAIEQMGHSFPLLITTADHALLNREIIENFCQQAEKTSCDIAIGLARRAEIERVDNTVKRTYFKFHDDDYSGCNLYYLKSRKALNAVEFWHKVDKIRKRPWALAKTFSITIMFKYLFGVLTLKAAMEYASKLLEVHAQAIIIPYGEAAIDVDKPEDHALVTKLLQQRR